jgi:tellurite resistance protein TerC
MGLPFSGNHARSIRRLYVYTSNVCAILGLAHSIFLAGALRYFRFLDAGISAVLMFIGGKILAEPWLYLPTPAAQGVIGLIVALAVGASIFTARGTS